nr:hypothetical protein [Planctomicrobium piriforme]
MWHSFRSTTIWNSFQSQAVNSLILAPASKYRIGSPLKHRHAL